MMTRVLESANMNEANEGENVLFSSFPNIDTLQSHSVEDREKSAIVTKDHQVIEYPLTVGIVSLALTPTKSNRYVKHIPSPLVDGLLPMKDRTMTENSHSNETSCVEPSNAFLYVETERPIGGRKDISVLLRSREACSHDKAELVSDNEESCENDSTAESREYNPLHFDDSENSKRNHESSDWDHYQSKRQRRNEYRSEVNHFFPSEFAIQVLSRTASFCTYDTVELEESLVEELSQCITSENFDANMNSLVPLLTPPSSPLTVMLDDEVATVCEWPSNLVVETAIQAATELRPLSPAESSWTNFS